MDRAVRRSVPHLQPVSQGTEGPSRSDATGVSLCAYAEGSHSSHRSTRHVQTWQQVYFDSYLCVHEVPYCDTDSRKDLHNGRSSVGASRVSNPTSGNHVTPEILVHDQGGEFWSQVMKDLAQLLDIQVSMMTSHRPQSNGVVEQVHQTMHTVFAKIVCNNQRDWCKLTSHVCFAYNTAVHASSTYSPYYLLHLRHNKTPLELLI